MKAMVWMLGVLVSVSITPNAWAWTVSEAPMGFDESLRETDRISGNMPASETVQNKKYPSRSTAVKKSPNAPIHPESWPVAEQSRDREGNPYDTLFKGISSNTRFEKKLAKLSDEEQADSDYSQALEWINQDMESKAEHLLEESLNRCPDHVSTRTELARLYLKKNRDVDAEMILSEGLKLSGDRAEFLKFMAMVMERKNEFTEAIAYLNKMPSKKKNEKEIIALFGHIHHRAGNFASARQEYSRLLRAEPANPLWVLGLTMALDGQGNHVAALEGYRRVRGNPNIETALLQYIEERILALKG